MSSASSVSRIMNACLDCTTSDRASLPMRSDPLADLRDRRRLVTHQRQELADVHALVAHALHVLDDVQERGDESQVARDRGLQGEEREDRLVYLEVAPVDAVVVLHDQRGELDVLVLQGLEGAVELGDDDVEAAHGGRLDLVELLGEVETVVPRHPISRTCR